ncbi:MULTISPECIES: sugar ABC transporter ATP-binding protein [unclassified Oceanispirochaeta]|uniref:sugar ABC transporter ATP-binding protein n=1 Tax=unclassified Oceanispirochaeta TaxID=2635722 RepID=UPI000E096C68|nr:MULTISPECIES: sugar ABC transporter ATP-binding protein [unclassified Oceanispirochaeta]MBF9018023.1 sugar ABC transporter ATP-binding protein [Oceanispirochaeta sp. M2]NPD74535.1 sugar ABC transporter ATP-binding protein [Oceanispirochaeta sp. M1]RDG29647.1 sugar ABC transporter ATP-binding protein [Oceanispirochaeta sp. M1]
MSTLLRMSGISKSFPGVKALDNVNLELEEGETLALVGENGAGKSTLMKVLSGMYKADEGHIEVRGEIVKNVGLKTMLQAGISVIYQELNLISYLSIAENIYLGREPLKKNGLIDWKTLYRQVEELLTSFDIDLDPRAKVYTIGPAIQQLVEIVKALSLKSDILIMDEPTAPLTGNEVDKLFKIIANLKAGGVSIIYISHRLEELQHVADRITVLRDGKNIITKPEKDFPVNEIISHMVGRKLSEQYPKAEIEIKEEILRVEGLSRESLCRDVSFSVHKGEIVGFSGLVGAGRTEIMELIYGHRKKDSGKIYLEGSEVSIRNPRDAVRLGIGLIPEERKKQGLILGLSIFDNSALTVLDLYSVLGILKRTFISGKVKNMIKKIDIKTPTIRQLAKNLSGGNQQKVVLSKWFIRDCHLYIFDEPTRGIDVGAKVEIYKLIQELAREGAGIILVSSELTEIMNMSDRIEVVYDGRIVKKFKRGESDQEEVMEYSLGLHDKGVTP